MPSTSRRTCEFLPSQKQTHTQIQIQMRRQMQKLQQIQVGAANGIESVLSWQDFALDEKINIQNLTE